MAIKLFHHPFSRAAGVVWPLEEIGEPYELVHVDFVKGEQKTGEVAALNPMGKIPVLQDGDTVVTEAAAIALYLADRYALGRLAPSPDDPRRAPYLRWALFAPSVIEPGVLARRQGWEFRPSSAGWGDYDAMVRTIDHALSAGDHLLGDDFSMADVVFGGTLRYMLRFGLMEATPRVTAYVERLSARPALQRADARNLAIIEERGLGT